MRSLGTRRAALLAGVATVAAVALAGCSAGQIAETSLKRPSNQGVNADNSDMSVAIRNLAVTYNGTTGYAKGDSAPLEVGLYNQTTQPITVLISSKPAENAVENDGVISAESVGLSGGPSATSAPSTTLPNPSGSRDAAVPETSSGPSGSVEQPSSSPSLAPDPSSSAVDDTAPSTEPARITIAPKGSVTFLPGDKESLLAVGLTGKLAPGGSINLVFEFSNGAAPLTLSAAVAIPLSPASRAPGNEDENTEG
jgi:hypothetical protein